MEPNDCFEELIKNYDVNEKKTILGSSFHIVRSNGYKEWLNTQS